MKRPELARIRAAANKIEQLLSIGDTRLLAMDGPCGDQNAATALTASESADLYTACLDILCETRNI